MKALLELLQDGRAWSIEELALRRHTTADDIKRQMAFLEHAGFLHRVASCGSQHCQGCSSSCSGAKGLGGAPIFWELVKK